MKIAAIVLAFTAFFVLLELLKRRLSLPVELSRKTAHVGSAIGAAALPLVATYAEIAVASAVFVPAMLISRKQNLFSAVHNVQRDSLGEVYFPVAVFLMAVLFPSSLPYVFGLLVMGLGDAAATFVGQSWGRKQYEVFGTTKTYVGSAAFAFTTFCIAAFALLVFSDESLLHVLTIATLCSVALTPVEGMSGHGLDNLSVPVAGGAIISWLP